jgi:hypothetical protein
MIPDNVMAIAWGHVIFNCVFKGTNVKIVVAIAREYGNKSLKKLPRSPAIKIINNNRPYLNLSLTTFNCLPTISMTSGAKNIPIKDESVHRIKEVINY